MRISSFRIRNYKSFNDSGNVVLAPGMNLVTGQNNAGKTALLQALELRAGYKEHISLEALPQRGRLHFQTNSVVDFAITVSGKELLEFTKHLPEISLAIPPDPAGRQHPLGLRYEGNYTSAGSLQDIWNWIHARPEITFLLTRTVTPLGSEHIAAARTPSHGLYDVNPLPGQSPLYLRRVIDSQGQETLYANYQTQSDFGLALAPAFVSRIYRFSAERYSLGECGFGDSAQLSPDARNLAEVLNVLQSNVQRFREYVELVQYVLPQIQWISVVPKPSNRLQIQVWNVDPRSGRDDLAISLTECGTGVGQVLAVIYTAFISDSSRVLLIDEPQSFLHPSAARNLIEALKRFSIHQYVISSHSAAVVAAADAKEILVLKVRSGVTSVRVADTSDNKLLNEFLNEIGARLSDVFGMERVIWVEGPTEQIIFPKILAELGKMTPGTAVVAIRNTGDLEKRDAERIFGIYNNLSSKASILPQTVVFVLDKELRTFEEQRLIEKMSGGRALFIPRRNIECYLLDASAVCGVCNDIERFNPEGVILDPVSVDERIHQMAKEHKYWPPDKPSDYPSLRSPLIDGARLLSDLFMKLSHMRVSYRKTVHSIALYSWIQQNNPEQLAELRDFLDGSVPRLERTAGHPHSRLGGN